MGRVHACGVPAVARWRALPLGQQLHWLLRLGVVGCFIGHGAYGFITKEAWVPYFGVVGIDRTWAYRIMPWIGAMLLRRCGFRQQECRIEAHATASWRVILVTAPLVAA
jgi:hypothetical protein